MKLFRVHSQNKCLLNDSILWSLLSKLLNENLKKKIEYIWKGGLLNFNWYLFCLCLLCLIMPKTWRKIIVNNYIFRLCVCVCLCVWISSITQERKVVESSTRCQNAYIFNTKNWLASCSKVHKNQMKIELLKVESMCRNLPYVIVLLNVVHFLAQTIQ